MRYNEYDADPAGLPEHTRIQHTVEGWWKLVVLVGRSRPHQQDKEQPGDLIATSDTRDGITTYTDLIAMETLGLPYGTENDLTAWIEGVCTLPPQLETHGYGFKSSLGTLHRKASSIGELTSTTHRPSSDLKRCGATRSS